MAEGKLPLTATRTIFLLQLLGQWCYNHEFIYKIYKYFVTLMHAAVILSLITYNVLHFGEPETSEVIYHTPAAVQGLIKFTLFRKNFEHVEELLRVMRAYKTDSGESRIAMWLLKYFNLIFVVAAVALVSFPLFGHERILPLLLYIPFDDKALGVFELIYIYVAFFVTHLGLVNSVTDIFFFIAMIHIENECEYLIGIVRNLDDFSTQEKKIHNLLLDCVKRYNVVLEFTKTLVECFKETLMLFFVLNFSLVILTTYQLSLAEAMSSNFFRALFFQSAVTAESFLFCYFGNRVLTKSQTLYYATFESKWYNASNKFKKDLLIFMQQLEHPITFYVWNVFPLNYETFKAVMQKAWSFYVALKNTHDMKLKTN